MLKINFNNYVRGADRALVRSAINFFLDELLPGKKGENTHLEVRFVRLRGAQGFCQIHDEETNEYYPRMFSIEVCGGMPMKDVIETLAHEMVHLRQFRNRELGHRNNYTLYRGKFYRPDLPYEKEPWEKEAYKLEKVLVEKFVAFTQQSE